MFSCEFCEISKNTYFYIAPPVAASERQDSHLKIKCIIIKIKRGFVQSDLALLELQKYLIKTSKDVLVLIIYCVSTPPLAAQNRYVAIKPLRRRGELVH